MRRLHLVVLLLLSLFAVNATSAQELWPRLLALPEGDITLYEPQIESLNELNMTARLAISVTPIDSDLPVYGTLWVVGKIKTDRAANRVICERIFVKQVRFPGAAEEQIQKFSTVLRNNLPQSDLEFPLDWLHSLMEQEKKEAAAESELGTAPPLIIPASRPTVLVTLQGNPILGKSDYKGLMKVINTPFHLFFEPGTSRYFLKAQYGGYDYVWMTRDLLGSWEAVRELTGSAAALFTSGPPPESNPEGVVIPEIRVATEPAEMVLVDGKPVLKAIPGTSLYLVGNSRSDILVELNERRIYVLLSGRWFTSLSKYGPWTYVSGDQLPPDFKKIPADFDRPNVLAAIPDNGLARIARLDVLAPQTAVIHRAGPTPSVAYEGAPLFEAIEGTSLKYAVNTESAVLSSGDRFLVCQDGVWFEGQGAEGPWTVAGEVPRDVAAIPPGCPVFPVKFVQVYESDENTVTVGYTPGYLGSYQLGSTVVFGTGLPFSGAKEGGFHPAPFTYGFNMVYDLWDRTWKSQSGVAEFLSPSRSWWGPGGFREVGDGVSHSDNQLKSDEPPNIYARNPEWLTGEAGQRVLAEGEEIADARVAQPDPAPQTAPEPVEAASSDARWEAIRRMSEAEKAQADQAEAEAEQRRAEAAVYSDEEGNVYRKNNDQWESVHSGQAAEPERRREFDRQYSSRSSSGSRSRGRSLLHTTGMMSKTGGFDGYVGGPEGMSRSDFYQELGFVEIPGFGW